MWELIVKSVTAGVAVIGALIAVFNYLDSRSKEILVATRESQKPFLELQLKRYDEATQATADLAILPRDGTKWSEARTRFWELYWGQLGLVEDRDVAAAMAEFQQALKQFEDNKGSQQQLAPLALKIAHACRRSIEKSWDYELPPLGGR